MGITQGLTLEQKQRMLQRLSPQQLLVVKLYEMPIAELVEEVKNEIYGNEALEEGLSKHSDDLQDDIDYGSEEIDESDSFEAPETYNMDILGDSEDDNSLSISDKGSKQAEMPIGQTITFIDDLWSQVANYDLTEQQLNILEFLIGTLDDNGYLASSTYDIVDDLMFSQSIYTSEDEVDEVIKILQQFDPPGIGARNTQECLLIQLDRMLGEGNSLSFEKLEQIQDARQIIAEHYTDFINNNREKLQRDLNYSAVHIEDVFSVLKKLNPHPGLSLCESVSGSAQTIIPDFIITTDQEGDITLTLNGGFMPSFHLSREYKEIANMLQGGSAKISRRDKERFEYMKDKVDKARMFIDAMRMRQQTLEKVMRAIIDMQRQFFVSQSERDLNCLRLTDVAERTGLSISTISRVCNSKYALVDGNTYKLAHFFKRNSTNSAGEEIDINDIKELLRTIVDSENKQKPYTDDELAKLIAERGGTKISRRTVNEYRKELGIPTSKNRKY